MKKRIFGTDGIRGTANLYPMTSEVALALGRSIAYQARKRFKRPKIVIGKDTRLSCYMIEAALISGVCSMGADVLLTGPIPTPGIAYLTVDMRCDAGIMITASHNSFEDNGIKVFGPDGFKFTDSQEDEIEQHILGHYSTDNLISTEDNSYPKEELVGKAFKIEDARGRYIAHLKSIFPKSMNLVGTKIAVDCANGAAYKIAPTVFEELGANVMVIGNKPNGTNINEECGAIYPNLLSNIVTSNSCDVGIALDGDADRLVVVDENGIMVDGDILLGKLLEDSCFKEAVVTTMSNAGLGNYASSLGCKLHRTKVGDRYVIDKMREYGIKFGGENSGHIIYMDYATTGDGIVAALKLLEMMKSRQIKASELSGEFSLYPQHIINLPVEKKMPLKEMTEMQEVIQLAYDHLNGEGRILVRYSGTEMKLRIMVESDDAKLAKQLAECIKTAAITSLQD
jgi:phosphoglucosamine mutase